MSDSGSERHSNDDGPTLWLEDLQPGREFRYGNYAVTRDEVIEFASRYDPQPFHMDDAAAAKSIFGRICASGMHTMAMAQRMQMDFFMENGVQVVAGLGMDQFRVTAPVYPGDTLHMVVVIEDARPSESRPGMGVLTYLSMVINQDGTVVSSYLSKLMMKCRPQTVPRVDA